MKRLKFWGALIIFVILLLKPNEAIRNAQNAMAVWYASVAPAMFPFLVLMPLLTSEEACKVYETIFSKCMRKLFRLPGQAVPAIIAGMIAGSPGGAITLRRVMKNSNMTVSQARRIAFALGGVSPAYLIMGVGQGLHGSISVGIKLAAIQVGVQLLMLKLIPDKETNEKIRLETITPEAKNSVVFAVESITVVCGYMVFYSVIAGAAANILGKRFGEILLPLIDLPSGLAGFVASDYSYKIFIEGIAIGFTGLCIISQNLSVLRELNLKWKNYIIAKLISAGLFGLSCTAIESNWGSVMINLPGSCAKTYAISVLSAGIIVIPGLLLLSKKLFLNIRKDTNEC